MRDDYGKTSGKKQKTVAFAFLKFSHHLTLPIKPTNLTFHSKYHKILSRLQKKNVPCKKLEDIKMIPCFFKNSR